MANKVVYAQKLNESQDGTGLSNGLLAEVAVTTESNAWALAILYILLSKTKMLFPNCFLPRPLPEVV